MKVLILTEGGSNIGFGHVTRTLSIAQAFKEKGVEPFMVVKGDDSLLPLLVGVEHKVVDWIENKTMLEELAEDKDIVVIDSYLAPKELYEFAYKKAGLLVSIDDFRRIDYPGGIVVNGNIYAEELNYPNKENITYLLGTKYTPLRKPFWKVPNKEIREQVKEILITFGGNDPKGMTPRVLETLTGEFPDLTKRVIIGKGFRNIEKIRAVADRNTEFIFSPGAEEMKELMLSADIAVSAGGQTLYELARVGVPTVAVVVAQNQVRNVLGWEKAGFVLNCPDVEGHCLRTLFDATLRRERSLIGRELLDGLGSLRVVKEAMGYEISR